ncbi:hypothetical protein CEUSTIGMA_g7816.t1 [Chlamydomonas eustigma]|uniref:RecA family profile 1 domain-containing protein n=1 Tax=Chlamydomonas eustigma TaxID=1157962 RepID=A0A250XBB8_9CHLO|nr:hypothetical protein CEUSTIGMA_g7816.t1 [Chlamydomonas eustigma]|eukprot:GAX80377.1 hypothetical protein CEUSTIGMA_g7816.t1 [Chlamydomonas eustigma]
MPNVHVNSIQGIDQDLLSKLSASQFCTAKDILFASDLDLIEILHVSKSQAIKLRHDVSAYVCPPRVSALELKMAVRVSLHLGLPTLDASMRCGVPAGGITELVGSAGVGKSQTCFQLALMTSAPLDCGGIGASVIYIDTERKFSSTRLSEMARCRFPHQLIPGSAALSNMLSRVLLISPTSIEQLMKCLEGLEAGIMQHRVGLVVLDSIAALVRSDLSGVSVTSTSVASRSHMGDGRVLNDSLGDSSIVARQEVIGQVASRLKYLAESFKIPVVVTNQVTTRFSDATTAHGFQQQQQLPSTMDQGHLTAALGTKWAHCVNVRLVLDRLAERRFMKVAKSPSSDNIACEYKITAQGVEEVFGSQVPVVISNKRNILAMTIEND